MDNLVTDKVAMVEKPTSSDEVIKMRGSVHLKLIGADGKVKLDLTKANLITTAGKTLLAQILKGTGTLPGYMAIGTANTATAVGQTALVGTELARVANDSATQSMNSVAYQATFPAGTGTGTIEEAGVFNAASVGTMLARFLTGTFTKGAGDTLVLTWTITFS